MVVEHEIKVRVRYADTDTMRVVYYANFFIWFESGRIELLRSRGIVYKDIEEMGIFIPVVEAKANYKAPARFDDELLVRTKLKEMGNTSLTFGNEVFRLPGMELLCTGHTVHVVVGRDGKPMPIPEALRAKLSA
ncbi:MAG: thioesterase family protein [Nitrososphaerales archaeon]|jgi:acyl-CoA thioester hydrolase